MVWPSAIKLAASPWDSGGPQILEIVGFGIGDRVRRRRTQTAMAPRRGRSEENPSLSCSTLGFRARSLVGLARPPFC